MRRDTANAIFWYILLTALLAVGLSSCSAPHPARPTADMTIGQQLRWCQAEHNRLGLGMPLKPYPSLYFPTYCR